MGGNRLPLEIEQANLTRFARHAEGKMCTPKTDFAQTAPIAPHDDRCDCTEEQKFLKNVIWGEPLQSVPMPTTVLGLDHWSIEEGKRRGYCR